MRNKFWSTSERKEKRYTNWLDEAHALNALSFSVEAEMDTIKMRVEIPQFDPQLGVWRYRMIATLNGTEIEIYNRNSSKIAPMPRLHPPQPAEMRAVSPTQKLYVEGQHYKIHDQKFSYESNKDSSVAPLLIEHDFDVDSNVFSQARLEFEYIEDFNEKTSLARIELTSDYENKD